MLYCVVCACCQDCQFGAVVVVYCAKTAIHEGVVDTAMALSRKHGKQFVVLARSRIVYRVCKRYKGELVVVACHGRDSVVT